MRTYRRLLRRVGTTALTVTAIASVLVAPMSSHAGARAGSVAADDNTITIWTDATRLPGFQLYQKSHPNVHVKIVSYLGKQLPAKISLFNRSGSGWPDVVFDEQPWEVASLSNSKLHYTADLTPLVSKSILKNFAPGQNEQCTFEGKLYCLRNDIAPNVLWYNTKLMKQFGYTLPTTWEQYQALGIKLGKEHPGYVIGSFGDDFGLWGYYWASACPVTQITAKDTVRINLSSPNCTRVAKLLDPLIANKTVATLSPFDPAMTKLGQQNKILMMPAAAWFGADMFEPAAGYHSPKGEIAAAPALRWTSDKVTYTGAEGGGAYFVSSHAKNLAAATDVAVWMSTSDAYQSVSPGLPAYIPAETAWAKTLEHDSFFATNPFPVLQQAVKQIEPHWGFVRYDTEGTFTTTIIGAAKAGKPIESVYNTFQTQLEQLAQTAGYKVVQ